MSHTHDEVYNTPEMKSKAVFNSKLLRKASAMHNENCPNYKNGSYLSNTAKVFHRHILKHQVLPKSYCKLYKFCYIKKEIKY